MSTIHWATGDVVYDADDDGYTPASRLALAAGSAPGNTTMRLTPVEVFPASLEHVPIRAYQITDET